MSKLLKRSEEIRQFILTQVDQYPSDIVSLTAQKFGTTRQGVNKHIKSLIEQKALIEMDPKGWTVLKGC